MLTVGFAPARRGILVAQVQLRNKKGNRFLYKLDQHYLNLALDILARAFVGQDLWLIDGVSAVKAVKRSYGTSPCSMTADDEARIQALYDRPLAAYDCVPLADDDPYRTEGSKGLRVQGREYVRLVRREAHAAAAE